MSALKIQPLIDALQKDVNYTLMQMQELQQMSSCELLQQPAPDKWSIAQVLEHLNGYNRFYLAEIDKALRGREHDETVEYKPGWFGNYFTRLMQPDEKGNIGKKMSAPKEYNFGPVLDVNKVLAEFTEGQKRLITLLEQARKSDLGGIKVPISLTKFIKLKLGDTLRFVIAHQMRHFVQINMVRQQIVANHAA